MANNDSHIDLIKRYYKKELSTSELSSFHNLIKIDPAFKKKYEAYAPDAKSSEKIVNKDSKKTLKDIKGSSPNNLMNEELKTKKSSFKNLRMILTALSVIILLCMCAFWFYNQTPSADQHVVIYEDYFEPYPNTYIDLKDVGSNPTELQQIMQQYEQKNYEIVIKRINAIPIDHRDDRLQFYEGVSLLAIGQADEAIKIFIESNDSGNMDVAEAAKWYGALALLKQNEILSARVQLEEIYKYGQVYKKAQAKELFDILTALK